MDYRKSVCVCVFFLTPPLWTTLLTQSQGRRCGIIVHPQNWSVARTTTCECLQRGERPKKSLQRNLSSSKFFFSFHDTPSCCLTSKFNVAPCVLAKSWAPAIFAWHRCHRPHSPSLWVKSECQERKGEIKVGEKKPKKGFACIKIMKTDNPDSVVLLFIYLFIFCFKLLY